MVTNTFVYIGLMDYGAGHLTVIVEMGTGAFANESCLLGQAFDKCFSNAWGKGGGDACGWN